MRNNLGIDKTTNSELFRSSIKPSCLLVLEEAACAESQLKDERKIKIWLTAHYSRFRIQRMVQYSGYYSKYDLQCLVQNSGYYSK